MKNRVCSSVHERTSEKMKNYYRIDYPAGFNLDLFVQGKALGGICPDLETKLRINDHVFAARYNTEDRLGEVRLVGKVRRLSPMIEIEWRTLEMDLRPSSQGVQHWRKQQFRFADAVADRYMLHAACEEIFAGEEDYLHAREVRAAVGKSYHCSNGSGDPGHIYVIRSPYGYKIGKSRRLHDRTRLFAVKLPFPINIVMTGWSDAHSREERRLHQMFAAKRLEGEWFDLDEADLIRLKGELPNSDESTA